MTSSEQLKTRYITDPWLAVVSLTLMAIGLVMLASASLGVAQQSYQDPFYYVLRQSIYVAVGVFTVFVAVRIPMAYWQRLANPLLVLSVVLLIAVLIPGIGKEVNGSYRWIDLGYFNLQASELAKLFLIVYFADFLTKKWQEINVSIKNLFKSLIPLVVVGALLLLEPDLGATAVIVGTVVGMFFIVGVRLSYFALFLLVAISGLVALIFAAPYRVERLLTFLHACEPEYHLNQGYQLCQALIAFGRGEWAGVGLGSGVQKEFYLPEAHTDFLLAVLGEELGAIGTILVIALFAALFYRAFQIAKQAEMQQKVFSALVAFGIAFWLGLQSLVNIGVNMGVLPTKGITLPLISYGGSSIVVTCLAIGMLLRISYESLSSKQPEDKRRKGVAWKAHAS